MIHATVFVQFLIICGIPFTTYSEGSMRHNQPNWNTKSYILDPSWIIDDGLSGNDVLSSSFLKKHADTDTLDALSHSPYDTTDSYLQSHHDTEYSGIINKEINDIFPLIIYTKVYCATIKLISCKCVLFRI